MLIEYFDIITEPHDVTKIEQKGKIMKKTIYLVLIFALLAGCNAQPAIPTPTAVDVGAIQTAAVKTAMASMPTATAVPPSETPTQPPTNTPVPPTKEPPASTPIPPTSTPDPLLGQDFSWNNVSEQESGGIKIQIARIVLADKAAVTNVDFSKVSKFDNMPVVLEVVFKVTNTSDKEINVYPDQGMVIAGTEQVKLLDYALVGSKFGDDISGKIYPGVTVVGGLWIGLKRNKVDDIQKISIAINGPSNDSFSSIGPDFHFDIDLSKRAHDPIPEELK